MNNTTTHAALDANKYHAIVDGKWAVIPPASPRTLTAILHDMLASGYTHVWVLENTGIVPDEAFLQEAQTDFKVLENWHEVMRQRVGMKSLTAYKRGSGEQRQLTVIFLQHTQWTLPKDLPAQDLIIAIRYLEQALGVPVTGSPASVGMRLLKQLNSNHDSWLVKPRTNLRELHFDAKSAKDVIWARPIAGSEIGRKWLHKIDKNGAYLCACVAYMFGAGEPVHVEGLEDIAKYAKSTAVWRCKLGQLPSSPMLPPLWDGGEWIANPIVAMLVKSGVQIEILEGYAFPTHHETLKKWALHMWDVRKTLLDATIYKNQTCAKIARSMSKQVATKTIGLSSYGRFDETDNYKERPDFKMIAVAGNYATMMYNMKKIEKQYNLLPVIVYMDALYYLTDHEDITIDMPDMPFGTRSLGGYKHEWAIPVDQGIVECLNSDTAPPSLKLQFLNAVAHV